MNLNFLHPGPQLTWKLTRHLINCTLSITRYYTKSMATVTSKKIVIVEDEMIIAADLSMQLSKRGYEILGMYPTAMEAVEAIKLNTPDLILMDISLDGDLDGIYAAEKISEFSNVPIIFLTSNTDESTFQRALATKPFGFVGKPFRISELERNIKLALHREEK